MKHLKPVLCTLLGLILGIASTLAVSSVLQSTWQVSSVAVVKAVNVEVYSDSSLTTPLLSINWGMLEPSETKNFTAYIYNNGNVPFLLSLAAQNWIPGNASDFMMLTWNYDGSLLAAKTSLEVVLSLHVSSDVEGIVSFSFDIIIVGAG